MIGLFLHLFMLLLLTPPCCRADTGSVCQERGRTATDSVEVSNIKAILYNLYDIQIFILVHQKNVQGFCHNLSQHKTNKCKYSVLSSFCLLLSPLIFFLKIGIYIISTHVNHNSKLLWQTWKHISGMHNACHDAATTRTVEDSLKLQSGECSCRIKPLCWLT